MSETNEIVEKLPPETPLPKPLGEKKLTADVSVNESKKDSDISMLEDEEMPTYSTISSSTKPNNSVTNYNQRNVPMEKSRSQSPEPSEEQDNEDNESVYVVSSTPDTDRNFDDIDDEEEEGDYDSEEMNDEEEDDEDDDDEDGREEYCRKRFERESDDSDQDRFERASDDFVLRHNNSLKQYYKERSLSLQDLTTADVRYNRRQNFSRHHQYYADQPVFKPNVYSPYALNSKPYQAIDRYENNESKVKRYIQNIKEQGRLANVQNHANIRDFKENNTKQIATGGKQIKEYAENVIKKLEQDELCENQVSTYATLERVENPEEQSLKLPTKSDSTDMHIPMEVDNSQINTKCNKYKKINGIIEFDEESEITCTPILKEELTINQTSEQINGTELTKNVINLRTLSYEEYMRGASQVDEEDEVYVDDGRRHDDHEDDDEDSGNNDDDDVEEDDDSEIKSTEICLISPEKTPSDTLNVKQTYTNATDSIKVTNVKLNFNDMKCDEKYKDKNHIKMINQSTETKAENVELKKLQTTLTERNIQFENLKIAYQKTLQENFTMKQEIDNLKKTVKKYEEYKSRVTKSTSVQTEKCENENSEKINDRNKLSNSDTKSQWSESGFSPSISNDIPKIINTDESKSVFEKTKNPPLSRAFITSSRILQTLSNITRKISTNLDQKNQVSFSEDPSSSGTPINSKKRKATEMLGEQPFKIPHTSGSVRKKINQDSQMNGISPENENYTENRNNSEGEKKEDEIEDEEKEDDTTKNDLGENLKYYVYHDEENSKERSFLIQAEETGKIPNKGSVRECGPYLLGNMEVRMTEVNGTINIWGKEINVDSTEEELNSTEKSTDKSADLKSSFCWQKTPQTNLLNRSYTSSTNKKLKSQSRFNDSNISKYSYFSDNNSIPKYSPDIFHHRRYSIDNNYNSRPQRLSWSGCKHLMEEQKHVYHSQHNDLDCTRCSCNNQHNHHHHHHRVKKCECHSCNRIQGCNSDNYRRHSFSGDLNKFPMDNQCLNHHCLKSENDDVFKNKFDHCQSNDKEENCHHFSRQCHSSKEITHSCNNKNNPIHSECRGNNCCRNSINQNDDDNDDDDFISAQQTLEQIEVQKKQLSGKKVRTLLMDLLKGCGDFRTPNTGKINKQPNTAGRDFNKPEIIVTPCTPRASYSNQSQSMEKHEC
ncbi:MATH and LRR domain-containing protein PFE0570w-like isoform X2 [Leptopilina boulardi]|uniref:MATH and LRR domain-containing protein PFE0570w-like isoform X2 n=1 Tax=Leptopilina boulardi TaxID=63433 RepID=UPI0021F50E7E|nr:MATH and LRR domain-containing protein PFE0570w-like isoform X2 [Leptopilina boulardi]